MSSFKVSGAIRRRRGAGDRRDAGGGAAAERTGPQDPARRQFVTGDMMALPFDDARFDVVTTGYGLRNVPELLPAVREIRRVLKPGGILLSLDFDRPSHPVVRAAYLPYLTLVGSLVGLVLHGDADTYRYIPESIRRYPGARAVAALIAREGFATSEHRPVFGGLMAIHLAVREGSAVLGFPFGDFVSH